MSDLGEMRTGTSGRDAAADARATLARVEPHFDRMGITRIANVTGLDRIGIPVVMVCRPNARSLAVSQGKGLDMDVARISGVMESVELYHAEHIDRPLKLGSMAELARSHHFADVGGMARVGGKRFTEDTPTLWIEGTDLVSGESRWLPFESVHTNFAVPRPHGSGYFDSSSNGLASGATQAQALTHGICEIIERDATALWNRLPARARRETGLDLDQARGVCRDVLDALSRADFQVAAWETTSDTGVPSFFSLIADLRDPNSHHGIGAAAHPIAETALLKSLLEAVQVRTTYISGARDDLQATEYSDSYRQSRRERAARLLAEHQPARLPSDTNGAGREASAPWLVERLRSVGVNEVLSVDLGKEDIGLPVFRIVIPGLEGPDDHDGYVPGKRARRLLGEVA